MSNKVMCNEMNLKTLEETIEMLAQANWSVQWKDHPSLSLSDEFTKRYPLLPADLSVVLNSVERCINPSNTAWLLNENDFNRSMNVAFQWDEWESLGVQSALANNDPAWEERIRSFWDVHIPVMISVKNGYGYAAVSLLPDEYGAIVAGYEPEFEEVEIVSGSMLEFLSKLAECVQTDDCATVFHRFS